MTAIIGLFGFGGAPAVDAVGRRMLAQMEQRGTAHSALWHDGSALLGVARYEWEMGAGFSGPVLVVQDGECAVAADASLYYRDDLRRRLAEAGIRPVGQTASHLILAAYRAWGERCAEYLEGDFAFVLWDRRARRVVCARDFAGKRPLHYAELPNGTLLVASTVGGVLAHPDCPKELNLVTIAESMASFINDQGATCYQAISRLDTARTLVRDRHRPSRVFSHWEPPIFEQSGGPPFEEAAAELREALGKSVSERLSPTGPTSVWMSGGRDSTAVFAAGEWVLRNRGSDQSLIPVSVGYPVGDPGREDEFIASVAAHWQRPVRWVDVENVPVLDEPETRAAKRDEPFAHLYEFWNRTLAQETNAAGMRVALDGIGGDQLFQVSNVYLADLLRSGNVFAVAREWKKRGLEGQGFRSFFRWAAEPILPSFAHSAARLLRGGRPLLSDHRRRAPEWMNRAFLREHRLDEFVRVRPKRKRHEGVGAAETRWYLTDPYFPTVFGMIAEYALEVGVETRSPINDRRIIELAATRPRIERVDGRETKLLLRHAMRDILPASVLGSRRGRTGVMSGYFDRGFRRAQAEYVVRELSSPLLAELGLVDRTALNQACARFARSGQRELGLRLFLTLQAELWLRAHHGEVGDGATRRRAESVTPVARAV